MSSSTAAAAALSAAASTISSSSSTSAGGTAAAAVSHAVLSASPAQFREIHKNTWLKRLTAEGKKITVGPKKSERSWVVFCVHDDTEALLEGYAEPRQAASHNPEWIVSLQDALHISHALIPNSHEFEFVVTLSNEVMRFHAMSWEIMQEWVETLRSKLREMKILSPKENLYTKLPEVRAPLLPTRDPTSPLPAPPPVPAALVPGVERVVPQSTLSEHSITASDIAEMPSGANSITPAASLSTLTAASDNSNRLASISSNSSTVATTQSNDSSTTSSITTATSTTTAPVLTSMSNTLTQNLLNMLSNPISTYSEQLHDENTVLSDDEDNSSNLASDSNVEFRSFSVLHRVNAEPIRQLNIPEFSNCTATTSENSIRVDIGPDHRISADQLKIFENLMQCDPLIPRPQTSRSLSAGAADKSKKQTSKYVSYARTHNNDVATSSSNNVTEFEINDATSKQTSNFSAMDVMPATASAATTADAKTNITIIQVSTPAKDKESNMQLPPKIPSKSTKAEIFKFPETHTAAEATTTKTRQLEYKSNVQIIPSNINSKTIQVLGQNSAAGSSSSSNISNQSQSNTVAVKKLFASQRHKTVTVAAANGAPVAVGATSISECPKVTTVHVAGDDLYGTCYSSNSIVATTTTTTTAITPKMSKKIILSANTSGITNISVNNSNDYVQTTSSGGTAAIADKEVKHHSGNVHYDKVFLSSSTPIVTQVTLVAAAHTTTTLTTTASNTTTISTNNVSNVVPTSPKVTTAQWHQHSARHGASSTTQISQQVASSSTHVALPDNSVKPTEQSATVTPANNRNKPKQSLTNTSHNNYAMAVDSTNGSPVLVRRQRLASPANTRTAAETNEAVSFTRPPMLTRGFTEALITARPSRRDFHFLRFTPAKVKSPKSAASSSNKNSAPIANPSNTHTNNNSDANGVSSSSNTPVHAAVNRINAATSVEQRRRSSSTSDAGNGARSTNNNEAAGNRNGVSGNGSGISHSVLRIQQPPYPLRNVLENNGIGAVNGVSADNSSSITPAITTTTSPVAKRLTLREQQVMQLRREIMHPGGVRLQLRRKDCLGSIAWVDAFGAVWVAGWKQKEHPVLYNALHIGDQLLSIAGMAITSATEANKIIRNANTLFVEVLVRRIPFGRGYAIRREREGQCLGLIRDGNTSTIVDVVPNSLAARHGLPPKAQSCDGSTLTFWVLTEINGRPLNLFFKDNEIRDRLNSVGRDISILVQPSDLITKLKKQLKSLRGYKDYLVQ